MCRGRRKRQIRELLPDQRLEVVRAKDHTTRAHPAVDLRRRGDGGSLYCRVHVGNGGLVPASPSPTKRGVHGLVGRTLVGIESGALRGAESGAEVFEIVAQADLGLLPNPVVDFLLQDGVGRDYVVLMRPHPPRLRRRARIEHDPAVLFDLLYPAMPRPGRVPLFVLFVVFKALPPPSACLAKRVTDHHAVERLTRGSWRRVHKPRGIPQRTKTAPGAVGRGKGVSSEVPELDI